MCIRIYIFDFKKQTNKQKKHIHKKTKTRIQKKQKKLKKKKNISGKLIKKEFAAARVKIFFITRISGNKSFFYLNIQN